MTDIENIQKVLKDSGYKLTNQRKAIIEVLIENKNRLLTAEEIYLKTKDIYADTNFSTIYRNLDILKNTGIIHNTKLNNDASVYELMCSENHHHHIICKGCGMTETIDFCPLDGMDSKLRDKNFTLTGHKFELYGYCKECDKNKLDK